MHDDEEEKVSTFDEVLGSINSGIQGGNVGIPIAFPRLRKYIPNIQQKQYILAGAQSKIGKTSIIDDIYLYGAYDWYKANKDAGTLDGIDLDIDYYSFEIDKVSKIIKGVSRKIWHDYGLVVDSNTILSKGENRCSKEIYDLVLSYRSYFEEMEDIVTIQAEPENVTGIRKYLLDKAAKNGEIVYKNINKDPLGPKILRFDKYIPKNPKRYWEIIVDHAALIKEESGMNLKQNIDALSKVFVMARNNFSATPILIQQMSGDGETDERFKSGRLTPTLRDFGDSKYTVRINCIAA